MLSCGGLCHTLQPLVLPDFSSFAGQSVSIFDQVL